MDANYLKHTAGNSLVEAIASFLLHPSGLPHAFSDAQYLKAAVKWQSLAGRDGDHSDRDHFTELASGDDAEPTEEGNSVASHQGQPGGIFVLAAQLRDPPAPPPLLREPINRLAMHLIQQVDVARAAESDRAARARVAAVVRVVAARERAMLETRRRVVAEIPAAVEAMAVRKEQRQAAAEAAAAREAERAAARAAEEAAEAAEAEAAAAALAAAAVEAAAGVAGPNALAMEVEGDAEEKDRADGGGREGLTDQAPSSSESGRVTREGDQSGSPDE
ncbi:hypothetical protein HK405_006049 [Cladochytrium tenue]|nr:hypothetical protein HK405_006049 [Cladochytrium tenue]